MIVGDYEELLNRRETTAALDRLNQFFKEKLCSNLNLQKVNAPMFVQSKTGMNDMLNGVERPVEFDANDATLHPLQVVHSLAKWKRDALKRYGFVPGEGILTEMRAIRRDEELDNLHSIYVDQWDWELAITKEERHVATLKSTVENIYSAVRATEQYISGLYPQITPILPEKLHYVTTQELEDQYPDLTPKAREDRIAEKYGAVFIMQIGGKLNSGKKHDGRSPDYDDWSLNGDLVVWFPVLQLSFELSSMGIRVDEDALITQLAESNHEDWSELPFHQSLLNHELPYSIGGGIGQSRLGMFMLRKAHVGEVQPSVWPTDMIEQCEQARIFLL